MKFVAQAVPAVVTFEFTWARVARVVATFAVKVTFPERRVSTPVEVMETPLSHEILPVPATHHVESSMSRKAHSYDNLVVPM